MRARVWGWKKREEIDSLEEKYMRWILGGIKKKRKDHKGGESDEMGEEDEKRGGRQSTSTVLEREKKG